MTTDDFQWDDTLGWILRRPLTKYIDLAPRNRQIWPYGYTKPDPQQLQTEGQGHVNDRIK